MDQFAMLTSHEQLLKHKNLKMTVHDLLYSKGYNFPKHFIKDLWSSLWTTRNSRWTTGGPPGPR